MSFEIKNCRADTLLEKNPTIPCKPYDDVFYEQLPEDQKRLIKACGYPSLPAMNAFEAMLLNIHFLDSYSKKTKGDPFDTKTTFEERFLKSTEIEPSKQDMLIPYNPVPKESRKNKPRLDFSETKTPNNTGAHSLFLYVEPKKRKYEELFFVCVPPGIPPPTPPEVLAMQVDLLEQLDMEQKKLLQAIQYIITSIKDSYKQTFLLQENPGTKSINTLAGEITAYKAKEKDEKKIVDIYTTYVFKVFLAYQSLTKSEIELENDKALRVKYEKLIAEAKAPEAQPRLTAGEGLELMTSMTAPKGWLEGTKKVARMIWGDITQKYKETRAWVYKKLPGYPSAEEMANLLQRIQTHEQDIERMKQKLEPIKEEMIQIRNALPAWYSQSTIELFVDTKLGLELRVVSEESKEAMQTEKRTYLENCKALEQQETTSEGKTYKDVVASILDVNKAFRESVNTNYISEDESNNTIYTKKVILNFMLQVPTPRENSFDEYKTIWGYGGCAPSGYYAPHKGRAKDTSFLLPTFESYIGLVLRYQIARRISNILVSN